MTIFADYIKTPNIYQTEIVNGKQKIEDHILEYETPYVKKRVGIIKGKKYSYFRKKPKHVTFRLKRRTSHSYHPNNKKYDKDCKTTRKIK